MQEKRYTITSSDVPDLRKCLTKWKELFGVDLSSAQLYFWFERYPTYMILRSFHVTHNWVLGRRPSIVIEMDAINYTSGVLRNMQRTQEKVDDLQRKADALLGGAL